jgi:type I restriction enzyme S subunit
LGDVGKIRMCKRIFSNETSEVGEIPFYKIGTFGKEADAYITNELYLNYREKFSFPKIGDILMSASGTLGRTVVYGGRPSYFQDSNIVWIDNKEEVITNSFLYYIYQIVRYDSEGGTIQRLYNSIINKAKFSRPSLPEQQKIASFLSAVDEKIQQLAKKKALLEQYKKGVMQQLFSGKLRFKDENGNPYPDWDEKRLIEFCSFFSGGTPSSTNKVFYSGTIPFIGSGNIYDSEVFSFISVEAFNSSSAKLVEKGDLLYALYGANSGEVAISQIEGAINQAILCIRTKESIEYLYYVLLGYKDNIVAKYLQGGQGNLSAQIIKKLKYKFPSIEEQQKIATYLISIDTKIEAVNNQITQTQAFKKGLLQQMFV